MLKSRYKEACSSCLSLSSPSISDSLRANASNIEATSFNKGSSNDSLRPSISDTSGRSVLSYLLYMSDIVEAIRFSSNRILRSSRTRHAPSADKQNHEASSLLASLSDNNSFLPNCHFHVFQKVEQIAVALCSILLNAVSTHECHYLMKTSLPLACCTIFDSSICCKITFYLSFRIQIADILPICAANNRE